jgi:gluconokinase
MSQNIPLTDSDRWDWLITLREAAANALLPTTTTATLPHMGVVVTCSALKRKYRDVIRVASYNDHNVHVHFIYLHASEETLIERVAARQGHYMHAAMVHSQFLSLEEPGETECKLDVLSVDCSGPADAVSQDVINRVRVVLEEGSAR